MKKKAEKKDYITKRKSTAPTFYYPFFENPNTRPLQMLGISIFQKRGQIKPSFIELCLLRRGSLDKMKDIKDYIEYVYDRKRGIFSIDKLDDILGRIPSEIFLRASYELIFCGVVTGVLNELISEGKFNLDDFCESLFVYFFNKRESAFGLPIDGKKITCTCEDTSWVLNLLLLLGRIDLLKEGSVKKTAQFICSLQTEEGYFLYSKEFENNGYLFCPIYQTLHGLLSLSILSHSVLPGAMEFCSTENVQNFILKDEKSSGGCGNCLMCNRILAELMRNTLEGRFYALSCLNIIKSDDKKNFSTEIEEAVQASIHSYLSSIFCEYFGKEYLYKFETIKRFKKQYKKLLRKDYLTKKERKGRDDLKYRIKYPIKRILINKNVKNDESYRRFLLDIHKVNNYEVDFKEFYYALSLCKLAKLQDFYSMNFKAIICSQTAKVKYVFFPYYWIITPLLYADFPALNVNIKEPIMFWGNKDKIIIIFSSTSNFNIKGFSFISFAGHLKDQNSDIVYPKYEDFKDYAFYFINNYGNMIHFGRIENFSISRKTNKANKDVITISLSIAKKDNRKSNTLSKSSWKSYGYAYLNFPLFSFQYNQSEIRFFLPNYEVMHLPSKQHLLRIIRQRVKDKDVILDGLIKILKNEILPNYGIKGIKTEMIEQILSSIPLRSILRQEEMEKIEKIERKVIKAFKREAKLTRATIEEKESITQKMILDNQRKIEAIIKDLKVNVKSLGKRKIRKAIKFLEKTSTKENYEVIERIKKFEKIFDDFKEQVKKNRLCVWHFKQGYLPDMFLEKLEKWGIQAGMPFFDFLRFLNELLRKNREEDFYYACPDIEHPCLEGKKTPISLSKCLKLSCAKSCDVSVVEKGLGFRLY